MQRADAAFDEFAGIVSTAERRLAEEQQPDAKPAGQDP